MHSIKDLMEKIKGFKTFRLTNLKVIPDDLFFALTIVLVAFGSFGLGRLSKIEGAKTPVRIENTPDSPVGTFKMTTVEKENAQTTSVITTQASELVGSKNGTKYYYSWCTGVQKISSSNLIHFVSKAEAESRGYSPSATCKGL